MDFRQHVGEKRHSYVRVASVLGSQMLFACVCVCVYLPIYISLCVMSVSHGTW